MSCRKREEGRERDGEGEEEREEEGEGLEGRRNGKLYRWGSFGSGRGNGRGGDMDEEN